MVGKFLFFLWTVYSAFERDTSWLENVMTIRVLTPENKKALEFGPELNRNFDFS